MWILLALLACAPEGTLRQPPAQTDTDTDADTDTVDTDTDTPEDTGPTGPCPAGMTQIPAAVPYCIDTFEAHLRDHSPYERPTGGEVAVSARGAVPQAYISGNEAADACAAAGKRLCSLDEWMRACQGSAGNTYPYGNSYQSSTCNTERSTHPIVELFGPNPAWSPTEMNDPRLNQLPDSLDPAGANPGCVSEDGVYDLHGNLHEWIADPGGVFKGGFYVDAVINGDGCYYRTTAHTNTYHDYSTGFRCCSSL